MHRVIVNIFLLVCVVLVSCTEEITMDLKSGDPVLVVDGVFTDEVREHEIILSISSDFFSNMPNPAVSDATVVLSDDFKQLVLEEDVNRPGVYIIPAQFNGVYGQVYTLDISDVDINGDGIHEEYSAFNVLYEPTRIEKISLGWDIAQGDKNWNILLYSKDNPDKEDFYAFSVYLNKELVSDKISELEYAWDRYFNGNDVSGVSVQQIVEEESDGEETEYYLKEGDWVKLEMQTINKDYYHFIDAVHEETGIQVPLFSGPPANVPGNISNGARGFFRVYSVDRDSIKVTQEILSLRDE